MAVIDLKKDLKDLYGPSAKAAALVDVPPMQFLMVDGRGDPNTSPAFSAAIAALYSVSYTLKFTLKKGEEPVDFPVMPLEALFWTDEQGALDIAHKGAWQWTCMIMQPSVVTEALVEAARAQAAAKKALPALSAVRFETFQEGVAAQILHVGPYAAEPPTIERLHAFIKEQGYVRAGKHHEIYLSDPNRTAPERLRTVIRQPVARA